MDDTIIATFPKIQGGGKQKIGDNWCLDNGHMHDSTPPMQ